jgi:hypothetical protein
MLKAFVLTAALLSPGLVLAAPLSLAGAVPGVSAGVEPAHYRSYRHHHRHRYVRAYRPTVINNYYLGDPDDIEDIVDAMHGD